AGHERRLVYPQGPHPGHRLPPPSRRPHPSRPLHDGSQDVRGGLTPSTARSAGLAIAPPSPKMPEKLGLSALLTDSPEGRTARGSSSRPSTCAAASAGDCGRGITPGSLSSAPPPPPWPAAGSSKAPASSPSLTSTALKKVAR